MKKTLPKDYINEDWTAKNITIKGKNITNIPEEEIYKLAKVVMNRVCTDDESKANAKNTKVNLFHIEADLDDGSHISIPLIVKKYGQKWCYLTPEYLMKNKEDW